MEEADIEDIQVKQCAVIHFFVRQGKMVKQTLNELRKTYTADEILPEKTVCPWHKAFWDGWKSLASQPNSGWLASQIKEVNANIIRIMIREDWHDNEKVYSSGRKHIFNVQGLTAL